MLGISIPTVKTRLHRARIALRDAIGGYFKPGE
jgi:DNA-directed RNA polymerase specialized sigma24 family protein